ncbi:hypothetical protein CDN99_13975 [Roseateles aquatilis]|uniref:Alkaline phosphatase n=1 Tax=Roseateles aquatilis TaxID=431061 RepID=A0A246JCR1_9BURK|nr:alkaline phosphatase D family protein [Roseateles aquatilis]OWQ90452.1 hypothetical protein CDN99_13975 [Roseateles aquatilis]
MSQRPPASLPRRQLLQAALAAGCTPAFLRHAHAQADAVDRFALGVASGCPRPDTVVLWTRLTGAALPERVELQWEIAEDERFERIAARGTEIAFAAEAHSVHAEPQGLKPDRWYWYRFRALGQQTATARTRTSPAPDAQVRSLRFATASCQRWDQGRYAAWADLSAREPDVVIFLGDYIYEYGTPADRHPPRRHAGGRCMTLADYRARYAQYKGDAQLRALHAQAPWISIWDDHEVDNDYAGDVDFALSPDFHHRRAGAVQAYWEHMPFPKSWKPDDGRMRLYTRFDWGRLARIHALDDRQYRDPQACPLPGHGGANTVMANDCAALKDPRRTLLGAEQEAWLAKGWDRDRGWNLLAQQTLMARLTHIPMSKGGRFWTDGWDGYPEARQRLLKDMVAAGARNPVVLGGDVHANVVADLKLDFQSERAPIIASEFCATSISSEGRAQSHMDTWRPLNPHIHLARSDTRGYMLFELDERRLQAEIRHVLKPWDEDSPVASLASFTVEAGRPGVQQA